MVRDGLLVSGGRDATFVGWDSETGEFLFAKRYCHGGEVSAVDVAGSEVIITGSRDCTIKLWCLKNAGKENNMNNNSVTTSFPSLAQTINMGDRIWSLSASPMGKKINI